MNRIPSYNSYNSTLYFNLSLTASSELFTSPCHMWMWLIEIDNRYEDADVANRSGNVSDKLHLHH